MKLNFLVYINWIIKDIDIKREWFEFSQNESQQSSEQEKKKHSLSHFNKQVACPYCFLSPSSLKDNGEASYSISELVPEYVHHEMGTRV